jgi:tetratricopeptide (TPR) repeat protein
MLALLAHRSGEYLAARKEAELALHIAEDHADAVRQIEALRILHGLDIEEGQDDLARARLSAALDLARASNNARYEALVHHDLAGLASCRGDLLRAQTDATSALRLAEDDPAAQAVYHRTLGNIARAQLDLDTARDHFTRALYLYRALASHEGEMEMLQLLAPFGSLSAT